MAFPRSFESTTMVRLADASTGVTPVLDYLDQVLQERDADITYRGDDFLEFTVSIGARLMGDLALRWRPGRTPLSFVGAGTFTTTLLRDYVVVSADVQISQYLVTRVGLFGLVSGALNPFGSVPSLVFGAAIGIALGAVSYGLARWEFNSWLADLDRRMRWQGEKPVRPTIR